MNLALTGAGARGAGATEDDGGGGDGDDGGGHGGQGDGLALAATVRSLAYPGGADWAAGASSVHAADGAGQLARTIRPGMPLLSALGAESASPRADASCDAAASSPPVDVTLTLALPLPLTLT